MPLGLVCSFLTCLRGPSVYKSHLWLSEAISPGFNHDYVHFDLPVCFGPLCCLSGAWHLGRGCGAFWCKCNFLFYLKNLAFSLCLFLILMCNKLTIIFSLISENRTWRRVSVCSYYYNTIQCIHAHSNFTKSSFLVLIVFLQVPCWSPPQTRARLWTSITPWEEASSPLLATCWKW